MWIPIDLGGIIHDFRTKVLPYNTTTKNKVYRAIFGSKIRFRANIYFADKIKLSNLVLTKIGQIFLLYNKINFLLKSSIQKYFLFSRI
jgi:hypothetical protein